MADHIAAHHAAGAYHRQTRVFLLRSLCHFDHRIGHTEQAVLAHIFRAFARSKQGIALVFQAGKAALHAPHARFRPDLFRARCSKARHLCTRREGKPELDAHAVHSLSGVKVRARAKLGDRAYLITQQQIRRAAGNMKQQDFLRKKVCAAGCKQRRSGMALLVGRINQRDVPRRCKCRRRVHTGQKARHITTLCRARLLGDTHSVDAGQIKLLRKLVQHFRQCCGVVEQCIALPQAQLPGFDRKKPLFCTNNLSGCIKNCQRGCIVACIDPERITAHCSAGSTAASSFRP